MAQRTQTRKKSTASTGRKKRRRRKGGGLFPKLVLLVVLIAVAFAAYKIGYTMFIGGSEPEKGTITGETVTITVPEGASTKAIAEILEENGLIKSAFRFRMDSKSEEIDGKYRHGTYTIDKGMTQTEIMHLLTTGGEQKEGIRLTIPEGYTTQQIADLVAELGLATVEEFMAAANSRDYEYAFVADIPDRDILLEGYLFPETYSIAEDATAHDIVNTLLGQFDKVVKNYQTQIDNSKYSLDELVIIASMIESEIKLDEERPTAAGVIYNRLAIDMPLQLDATVLYAQGIRKEYLSLEDIAFESEYNTYQKYGLPLGPISNPGETSFAAAVQPEDNDYLYYVLKEKGGSAHVYTETYDEFLRAKNAYKNS